MRIAIVGGDERVPHHRWPQGLDLRFYQGEKYGGNGQLKGLCQALTNGKFDAVVIMTRWIGHSMDGAVRRATTGTPIVLWDRGQGELAKALEGLLKERGL
jgi:hypothetical protein